MPKDARSIVRTVRVFKELACARRPLTSRELVNRLGAPRSSVARLLRSLVGLGVIAMDRRRATYLPTSKFAHLGAWLADSWRCNHALLDSLEQLARDTGETISFASPSDLEMEIVHAINFSGGLSWSAEVGQRFTAFGSAVGAARLATLSTTTIRSMYARAQRLPPERRPIVSLQAVLESVRGVREAGIAYAVGALHEDVAALAAKLPVNTDPCALYVAVGGLSKTFSARRGELEARLLRFLHEVHSL